MRDPERFLEALEDAFAILVWVLCARTSTTTHAHGQRKEKNTHSLGVFALLLVLALFVRPRVALALALFHAPRWLLPPQMTRGVHGRRLVRLLQQLGPMQRRLGNQRIIPIHLKHPRPLQRPNDQRDRRQLRPTLRDRVFVDGKGLHVEIVGEVFEPRPTLGCDLGGEEEEAEGEGGRVDLGGEDGGAFADEFEDGGDFGVPVVFLLSQGQLP